ncbi:hypothetical protein bcgnr5369_14530 [Bacillus cereus]|uniref:Uncharacterized protein n=1 Tax=Bacillus thuringiensis TaxID=1428 RepID=A0A9X6WG36_BACTU|nr:hypothetical protein [Bacillus thuringiensis]PFJ27806.1 hypothetical protein COJ15_33940 [Bacillus thuringiensis]
MMESISNPTSDDITLLHKQWNKHIEQNKLVFLFEDPIFYDALLHMEFSDVKSSAILSVSGKVEGASIRLFKSLSRPFLPSSKPYWIVYINDKSSGESFEVTTYEGDALFYCLNAFPWEDIERALRRKK